MKKLLAALVATLFAAGVAVAQDKKADAKKEAAPAAKSEMKKDAAPAKSDMKKEAAPAAKKDEKKTEAKK